SGNVRVDWFLNGTCAGNAQATTTVALNAAGTFDASAFNFTVNTPGAVAFRAHYPGDNTYMTSDGACQPLQGVAARIHITPDDTNEVSQSHTFTVLVEKNVGAGWVPAVAADQTHVDVTLANKNGAINQISPTTTCGYPVGNNPGTNTDANGQCTITF